MKLIEINLLPEEMRRKESPLSKLNISSVFISNVSFAKFAVAACSVLLLIHVVLFGLDLAARTKLGSIAKEEGLLGDREKEAIALKASAEMMNGKKAAIDELMVKRFEWAKKMNDLSDSMTAGIWLSEFSYEGGGEGSYGRRGIRDSADGKGSKQMIISGYALSKDDEGTASVGKFIKSLKDNAGFYADFRDIELGTIKRDKVEGQDVMAFRLTCLFKDAE